MSSLLKAAHDCFTLLSSRKTGQDKLKPQILYGDQIEKRRLLSGGANTWWQGHVFSWDDSRAVPNHRSTTPTPRSRYSTLIWQSLCFKDGLLPHHTQHNDLKFWQTSPPQQSPPSVLHAQQWFLQVCQDRSEFSNPISISAIHPLQAFSPFDALFH